MYVFEYVNQVIIETRPRSIRTMMAGFEDDKYGRRDIDVAQRRHDVPRGWHLEYGKMIVSIQCGSYSYCDYYDVWRESTFYLEHPHTTTAEVAVFENQHPWRLVKLADGQISGSWMTISEIDHIIKTIAEYAGHIIVADQS